MLSFFISSTFRDMQSERDIISKNVLPRLQFMTNERGVSVSFTDLRWGINTEKLDEKKGLEKILDVCVRKIDSSHPYFIVLIGDRYGTVPSAEVVESFLNSSSGKAFSRNEVAGKSVTALEISYATNHLSRNASEGLIICMREVSEPDSLPPHMRDRLLPGTLEEREKVDKLKKELCERFPDSILRYKVSWDPEANKLKGLDEFEDRLYDLIVRKIRRALPPGPVSPQEMRRLKAEQLIRQCNEIRIPFSEADEIYRQFFSSGRILMIFGKTGSGKTMQLSTLAQMAQNSGDHVVPLLEPLVNESGIVNEFLRDVLYNLAPEKYASQQDARLNKEAASTASLRNKAEELIDDASKTGKVIFLIDDLDEYDENTRIKLIRELPLGNDHVRIAITARSADMLPEFITGNYPVSYLNIGMGDSAFVTSMVQKMLETSGKELSADVLDAIVKASLFRTPLYTEILTDYIGRLDAEDFGRISRMEGIENGSERINKYLTDLVDTLPADELSLAKTLLRSIDEHAETKLSDFVVNLLCMFPDGLRMQDFLAIYGRLFRDEAISELSLVLFIENAASLFNSESEWIKLRHTLFAPDMEYCRFLLPAVTYHMSSLPDSDPLKIREYVPTALYYGDSEHAASYLKDCPEAITSLKSHLFSRDRYPQADSLHRILNQAASWSMPDTAGLVSAFLFSYDDLFRQLSTDDTQRVMEQLYRLCEEKIIDEAWSAVKKERTRQSVEHFRICYVCCEQKGIRADNYGVMKEMYLEFHSKCRALLSLMKPEDPIYADILQDYCISIEKLCDLHSFSIEERMSMMDDALRVIDDYYSTGHDERITRFKIHMKFHKAEVLVEKASLNKRIGWPDDILTEHLDEVEKAASDLAGYHISAGDFRNDEGTWICRAYRTLTEAYRSTAEVDREKELFYAKKYLDSGREWYKSSGNYFALDMIRNGCLRLALEDENLPLKQKCQYLYEACDASFAMKGHIQDEQYVRVTKPVLNEMLNHSIRYAASLKSEISIRNETVIAEALCRAIEILYHDPVLFTVYLNLDKNETEKRESLCLQILSELSAAAHGVYQEMIRRAQRKDFENAVRLAELLDRCITALDKAGSDARFFKIVQAYYLDISAVYHNYRIYNLPDIGDTRGLSKKEYHFKEMAAVFNTLLLLAYHVEEKDYDSFRIKTFGGWWDVIEPNVWLRTAAYVLHSDSRRIESFWNFLEKHYYSGMRFDYLLSLAAQTPEGDEVIESIGSYIADHLEEERISNFLVRNDLFEATALEYAYRHNLTEIAHKIIYNKYSGYLELPMLLIIRRYDRKEYERIFPTLAIGCLKRLREDLRLVSRKNLPGVNDLAQYLIKDMDEKEQNAIGTLRDRKLLDHYDALYVVSESVVSERQTEAFTPLIIFAQKGSYIQFADCMLTDSTPEGLRAGIRTLSVRMTNRGFREAKRIFCSSDEIRECVNSCFASEESPSDSDNPAPANIRRLRAIRSKARKFAGNQLHGRKLDGMDKAQLLAYLTASCACMELGWNDRKYNKPEDPNMTLPEWARSAAINIMLWPEPRRWFR